MDETNIHEYEAELKKWGRDHYNAVAISRTGHFMQDHTHFASNELLLKEEESHFENKFDNLLVFHDRLFSFMLHGGRSILTNLSHFVSDMFTHLDENEPMFFHEYLLYTLMRCSETPECTLLTHPMKLCYLILQKGNTLPEYVFTVLYYHFKHTDHKFDFETIKRNIDIIITNPKLSICNLYTSHFDHLDYADQFEIEHEHIVHAPID